MRLTIALLFLMACKPEVGFERAEVEKTGAKLFEEVTGLKPDKFVCPGDKQRLIGDLVCTATVGGETISVDARITTEGGLLGDGNLNINVKTHLFGKMVQKQMLEQYPANKVPMTAVTCPPVVKLVAGGTFTCDATIENQPYKVEVTMSSDGWNSRIVQ